jgi:dTMP kinase
MPKSGCFISIEGVEGVGKSTQIEAVMNVLQQQQIDAVLTREPGGTELGEAIRALLLSKDYPPMSHRTELLLMYAARAEHVDHKIRPLLSDGKWVVSDRFADASFAYQGGGRQIPMELLKSLDDWTLAGFEPDYTLLLDAPAEVGLARAATRGVKDRIELEDMGFFNRVRDTYLARAAEDPKRFRIIDASQDIESVRALVVATMNDIIGHWDSL